VTSAAGVPVVYAGRRQIDLPVHRDIVVLDEWEALPRDLGEALEQATQLIILDPLSFPFESLAPRLWDVPMAVAVPPGIGSGELHALLGGPALSRLGFHDLVIGAGARWGELARTYHLPQANGLPFASTEASAAVLYLAEQAAIHQEVQAQLEARSARRRYAWALRTRAGKSAWSLEAGAVAEEFKRVATTVPRSASGSAVVLGCGSGEWLMVAKRAGFRVIGFDLNHAAVQRARFNYPEVRVHHPGLRPTGFGLHEAADVALVAGVLGTLNEEARLRMLSWMWAALRPGGSLVVLDDFVGDPGGGSWIPAAMLTAAMLEVTANHAVLEEARALRLEDDGFHRVGLLTYAKLGAAERL
jgi:SAM-dependent methyltransferase